MNKHVKKYKEIVDELVKKSFPRLKKVKIFVWTPGFQIKKFYE